MLPAQEYSRHWQGLTQVTVAAGVAGTGVSVACSGHLPDISPDRHNRAGNGSNTASAG